MVGTTTERANFEVPAWLPLDTEESVVGTQWHQEAIDALATMLVEVGRRHGTAWGIARGITHFQVVEQVSYDGVANLYLRGREGAAVRALRNVRPARVGGMD